MSAAHEKLPQGYRLKERIDLLHNRRQLRSVVFLSFVVLIAGAGLGVWLRPQLSSLFSGGIWLSLFRLAVMAAAIALYIIGHEAVHGALMWFYSRKRPSFGISLMYAYAGSKVWFGKYPYLSIALAPVVLWGLALTVLALHVPPDWFWVVWGVQLTNLSGAAGDLYVSWRVVRMPSGVLIQDSGTSMTLWIHA